MWLWSKELLRRKTIVDTHRESREEMYNESIAKIIERKKIVLFPLCHNDDNDDDYDDNDKRERESNEKLLCKKALL